MQSKITSFSVKFSLQLFWIFQYGIGIYRKLLIVLREFTEVCHQISGPTIILVDHKFPNELVSCFCKMIIIISSHLVFIGY